MDLRPTVNSPRRIAWFAPWTWKRRTLWTIAVITLIGIYFESPVILGALDRPVPMVVGGRLVRRPTLSFPGPLFYPLLYCCEHHPICIEFYRAQADVLMPIRDYLRYQSAVAPVQTLKASGNSPKRNGPPTPEGLIDRPRFDIETGRVDKIDVREDPQEKSHD